MKILLYTDPHWSQYSSIVRRRGQDYSQRLENLIMSISWAEGLSETNGCDQVICLGDFFDTAFLNSEEATALQDVKWNLSIPHYFLVGNHESPIASLEYSSTKVLEAFGFNIVSSLVGFDYGDTGLVLIPYILEENREPLKAYLNVSKAKQKVVLSHNDIKGINYGMYTSKEGFDLVDIESNCDLFINGHLHNSGFLNDKETILNLGNITGQNFSEDAFRYSHFACILDTETLQLSFFENPHAFNFYKIEISKTEDLTKLYTLKNHAVVTIKCREELLEEVKKLLPQITNIVESRLIAYRDVYIPDSDNDVNEISLSGMDYIKKFTEFILQNVGDNDIVKEELSHISQGGN